MKRAELEAFAAYIDAAVELRLSKALAARPTHAIDEDAIVARVLERIRVPKDGEPGAPGKDAVVDVSAIVHDVLALVPAPKDGRDAVVDVAAIAAEVRAQIPAPKDGKDAVVDVPAIVAEVVALIPVPKDGAPAPPVDKLEIARDVLALIPVPKDGKDGIASRDELLAAVNAAVATAVTPAVNAGVEAALEQRPDVRYRDVWRAENSYREGHLVTFGGSIWHCNQTGTTAKPDGTSDDWTLAVKRGRDGRDQAKVK